MLWGRAYDLVMMIRFIPEMQPKLTKQRLLDQSSDFLLIP
jgi:hypothetical protein